MRTKLYELVHQLKVEFPIRTLCKVIGVGCNAYYNYHKGQTYELKAAKQRIADEIELIFEQHEGRFGLGIQIIFNRPRRPTDNAKVERIQQTTKNWADITKAANRAALQHQLDEALINQRAYCKVRRLAGKTRLQTFPQIINNPRLYLNDLEFELELLDTTRVYQAIAKWQFIQQLSKSGQFSLYNQIYYVDYKRAKTYVIIKLNIDNLEWTIVDANGNNLRSIKAKNFDLENILNLTIFQRTKKN